jgi:alpha-L-rhamnosidase
VVKGQKLRLRVAEMLEKDGTLYTDNYRSARSEVTYLPAQGGLLDWQPTFSFFGFRYVEVSGFDPAATPAASWVRGIVLHTDFPRTGTFTSSDDYLNRLASNIEWGQRGNFLDIPTDCPQRNERLGWTGDAQVFSPVGLYQFDSHAFFMSWVQSLREAQTPDGRLPNVVPARGAYGGKSGTHGSSGWTDALVIIPWNVYVQTGDATILRESFDAMCRLVDFDEDLYTQNGFKTRQSYGDWLQPKFIPEDGIQTKPNNTAGQTPKELIGACHLGHTAGICAQAARVLGLPIDAAKYDALVARIRRDVSAQYFTPEGKLTTKLETQTGYLLPLAFGLVNADLVPRVQQKLSALVRADGNLLNTGFLGTPHINRVLDEAGCTEQALQVLFTRQYPSWFYSIDQGATTMWERWNSYSHEKGFGPVGMNSFNHYAYGVIGQWIVERLVGLAPDPVQPGYRHLLVRPLLHSPLTMAKANLETRYGPAAISWTRNGHTVRLTVLVPPNATATVRLPATTATAARWTNAPRGREAATALAGGEARFDVPAGRHEFEVTLAQR